MEETWKRIAGYEDYEISTLGRVKSDLSKRGEFRRFSFKRKQGGYAQVRLKSSVTGKQETKYVHRLVAEAFIARVDGKPDVNHRDGVTKNNCVENLEWCTHRENILDAIRRRGNWFVGDLGRSRMKPVRMVDPETEEERVFESGMAAVRWLGEQQVAAGGMPMKVGASANICNAKDKGKIAYGYRWYSLSKAAYKKRSRVLGRVQA